MKNDLLLNIKITITLQTKMCRSPLGSVITLLGWWDTYPAFLNRLSFTLNFIEFILACVYMSFILYSRIMILVCSSVILFKTINIAIFLYQIYKERSREYKYALPLDGFSPVESSTAITTFLEFPIVFIAGMQIQIENIGYTHIPFFTYGILYMIKIFVVYYLPNRYMSDRM